MNNKGEERWWIDLHGTCELEQRLHAIANFVVSSRLRFARIFIFNRKYKVPNFATDEKRRTLGAMRVVHLIKIT